MSSRFLEAAAALFLVSAATAWAEDLKVCADPANLPLSNRMGEGYENKIAALVARELGRPLTFVWWTDRRSSALEALARHQCDLVPGALSDAPKVATTTPYLRSAYAFVTRRGTATPASFEDPRLRAMTIGVQSVGDEAVTPAAAALLRHGLERNIRAFTLAGHYSDPNSSAEIVRAVAKGELDAAIIWGPFAGYFARLQSAPVAVTLVQAAAGDPPLAYAIAMATRPDDIALRDSINRILEQRRGDIARILDGFGVPRLPEGAKP